MPTQNRLTSLSKQSHLMVGGAVAAATALSAGSASAELIITNIDQTAENGTIFLDVNGDWVNDFAITSFEAGASFPVIVGDEMKVKKPRTSKFSFANIKGLKNNSGDVINFDAVIDDKMMIGPNTQGRVLVDTSTYVQGPPFVERLGEGDPVNGDSGKFGTFGSFYVDEDAFSEVAARTLDVPTETIIGPFSEIGDTGYIGLSLTVGEAFCCDDFILQTEEMTDVGRIAIIDKEPQVYYGWAEVERGSLQVIRIGFEDTPFTTAWIPGGPIGVSEPATLPLIALGAAGLMGLRRRKKMAA